VQVKGEVDPFQLTTGTDGKFDWDTLFRQGGTETAEPPLCHTQALAAHHL